MLHLRIPEDVVEETDLRFLGWRSSAVALVPGARSTRDMCCLRQWRAQHQQSEFLAFRNPRYCLKIRSRQDDRLRSAFWAFQNHLVCERAQHVGFAGPDIT